MVRAADQPISTELRMADGVFIKTMVVAERGTYIPQHSHAYPHMSVIVKGAVRVWQGDFWHGDFKAPNAVLIEAGVLHLFMTLVEFTTVMCVHDIGEAESVMLLEEHQIKEA